MARFQKYPAYTTDEPVILRDFSGGINTNPAEGNLLDTELKDALNLHYNNSILEKRLGAHVLASLVYPGDKARHQGLFTFSTQNNSWIVIACDGKFYYSEYKTGTLRFTYLNIDVSQYMLLSSRDANPLNLISGLDKSFSLKTSMHTGYVHAIDADVGSLIFQNYRPIEAATIDYTLYVATGTRFVTIKESGSGLEATIVVPKITYGYEQKQIGFNYLSPYPEHLVENLEEAPLTSISNIYNPKVQTIVGQNQFKAVMTYAAGKSAGDYRFKWELSSDNGKTWTQLTQYRDAKAGVAKQPVTGKGADSIYIKDMRANVTYKIRCSFAAAFKMELGTDQKYYYVEEANGIDWVVDKVDGEWFGQAVIEVTCKSITSTMPINQNFLNIQSCTKIVSDGNKLILYDDINESGCWYKTVIGKYNYITDRGSLNFQTTKNEKLIKVVNFQGVLVVFANNKNLGGHISVVIGNGDDVSADNTFSPYQRKIVNTNITCDNAASVQMTDNYLIFKQRDTIYLLDSSELNAEILSVISVNDRVRIKNPEIEIPWEDENYFTEVTQDYYGIIWPNSTQRWKMYYRYPTRIGNDQKVFFPWIRDESPSFNIYDVLMLNGLPTHLGSNNSLLQYTSTTYTDEGQHIYDVQIVMKPNEMRYPGLVKFLHSADVNYYRGQEEPSALEIIIRNEAGFLLSDGNRRAFLYNGQIKYGNYENVTMDVSSTQDKAALVANETVVDEKVRYDTAGMETKTVVPRYKFPFYAAGVSLKMHSPQRFSFVGVTFHFVSTDISDSTIFDTYTRIVNSKGI